WTIVADPTAVNGQALGQLSNDRTDYRFPLAIYKPYSGKDLELSVRLDYRFPLAIYKPYSGKDLELSVRFKAVAGTVDEAGGVVLRLSTPDDYYVARANVLEDNVRFYRVVKGRREQLAGAHLHVSANQWPMLTLRDEENA